MKSRTSTGSGRATPNDDRAQVSPASANASASGAATNTQINNGRHCIGTRAS